MPQPRVSVIIVSYNTSRLLSRCLRSLYEDPDHRQWEIIVVDNGSADDTVPMLARQFPRVTLVAVESNQGFARGNNRGAKMASGRYLLFLNPDTEVPPGVINGLAQFLDDTADAAIVGPRLTNLDGSLQHSKRAFPGPLTTFLEYSGLERLAPRRRPFGRPRLTYLDEKGTHRVDYVAGACLMICREYFDRVGGWCEDYLLYAEDADLCAGVEKVGGSIYYHGKYQVMHVGGASSSQLGMPATVEAHRSVFLFVLRHRGVMAFWLTRLITAVGVAARGLLLGLGLPVLALAGRTQPWRERLRKYGRVLALCFSRRPLPTGRFVK